MGIGDQLIGSGLARGAADRGKRIAFGDGHRIRWDKNSKEIFRKNKNIAIPGTERQSDIEWVHFYTGNRLYNKQAGNRWLWNYDFKVTPGEIFLDREEIELSKRHRPGFILIEPNVPWYKTVAVNKDWGRSNYQAVSNELRLKGHEVVQLSFGRDRLAGVKIVQVSSFREALAVMMRAKMVIVPEGGLHHGAAAIGKRAVVLFGGFIPPAVTGYDTHINLVGSDQFCGTIGRCKHCADAMKSISIETVINASEEILSG